MRRIRRIAAVLALLFSVGASYAQQQNVINSTGPVGIGVTTSLATPLTVGRDLELDSYNDGTTRWGLVQGYDHSTSTPRPIWFEGSKFFFSSGNVGIGAASPGAKLHVGTTGTQSPFTYSTSNGDGLLFNFYNDTFPYVRHADIVSSAADASAADIKFFTKASSANPLERVRIDSAGNVGIGTTNPNSGKLQVTSAGGTSVSGGGASLAYFQSNSSFGGISLGAPASSNTFFEFLEYTPEGTIIKKAGLNWDAASTAFSIQSASDFNFQLPNGTGTLATIKASGSVGIGTTSPSALLHVGGGSQLSGNFYNTSRITNSAGTKGLYLGYDNASSNGIISSVDGTDIQFWSYNGSWGERVRISNTGNVGIGTTTPLLKFQVRPGTNSNFAVGDSAAGFGYAGPLLDAYDDSATLVPMTYNASKHVFSNGNVGIGTLSPGAQLDIRAGASTSNQALVVTSTGSLANNDIVRMQILGLTNGFRMFQDASSNVVYSFEGGRVGIGTTTPGYKLDVNGDTNVTGNLNITANGAGTGNIVAAGTINAKYQDVAEWVPASEQLSAGTVVVLDSTKSNQVTSSSVSYDTRVAGVVSEQPGIALGEKSEGKVLVATTGRVRVNVDATKGPIHIGDLLVTSDVPGVAMKSEAVNLGGVQFHRPGTLIGKALEPLEKGKGEILVLLSLQ